MFYNFLIIKHIILYTKYQPYNVFTVNLHTPLCKLYHFIIVLSFATELKRPSLQKRWDFVLPILLLQWLQNITVQPWSVDILSSSLLWLEGETKVSIWALCRINFVSTIKCFTFLWSLHSLFSGLYYKTITIITLTIISDATIWSITYDHNWQH